MMRAAALLAGALLLTAASPAPPAKDIDRTLARIYGPYRTADNSSPDWESPVWSAAMSKLITAWQKHIGDELTGLNDYGWFCECQDWDEKTFRWTRTGMRALSPGRIEVTVQVRPGAEVRNTQRLVLVREGMSWKLDDLTSQSAPQGVRKALQDEIAEPVGG